MSPGEVLMRARDAGLRTRWRFRPPSNGDPPFRPGTAAPFATPLPADAARRVHPAARTALIGAADRLLSGRWSIFGLELDVFDATWDWFHDPSTARRAPSDRYAFSIDHRDEAETGNVKYVWEISRHHHLTLLAAAFYLTGDARYADRVREHLDSWWRANPFLTGIHWSSGIEVGMRLIAWSWVRRLLNDWEAASSLFENNVRFRAQLLAHQRYLSRLRSHGSSANNHLIAELTGLFVSCCAFPIAVEADRWRQEAAEALVREAGRQTFPDGINRELASDYHGFVLELLLLAALEGEASGHPLGSEAWRTIRSMVDALAGMVDCSLRPPRQGDGDDASGLLLDPPGYDRVGDLLNSGAELFGGLEWWPEVPSRAESVRAPLWTALARPPRLGEDRPAARPDLFPDAGFAILRSEAGTADEIWCRCDHGPLGFLSTAAHGHADALSIELRIGGIDLLADPGTYCYHGEPPWRAYFQSTLGHNTLELAGRDQSSRRGPFLWSDHASARLLSVEGLSGGPNASWRAVHDGYGDLEPPAIHERTVRLDREARLLHILDRIEGRGEHPARLAYHLGPAISAHLEGYRVDCLWSGEHGERQATILLPAGLEWTLTRGQSSPPLGWYAPGFGRRLPANTLIGSGQVAGGQGLITQLQV